jgi:hypothetical protein
MPPFHIDFFDLGSLKKNCALDSNFIKSGPAEDIDICLPETYLEKKRNRYKIATNNALRWLRLFLKYADVLSFCERFS